MKGENGQGCAIEKGWTSASKGPRESREQTNLLFLQAARFEVRLFDKIPAVSFVFRDDEIPMNVDTWHEKKKLSIVARNDEVAKEKLETDPKFARPHYAPVEFQAYYGNWFKDKFSHLDDKGKLYPFIPCFKIAFRYKLP